jgi:curved DNA-binding protein CbpA
VVRPSKPATAAPRARQPEGPHAILGITAAATDEEVKAAFRRGALEHHPDLGGDAAAFIKVREAYAKIMKRRAR